MRSPALVFRWLCPQWPAVVSAAVSSRLRAMAACGPFPAVCTIPAAGDAQRPCKYTYICFSEQTFLYFSTLKFIGLYKYPNICLFTFLFFRVFICLLFYLFGLLFVCFSVCLFLYLFIFSAVYLFIYSVFRLFVCLFLCAFIYLYAKNAVFHLFIYFFIHTSRSNNRAKRNPCDGIFVAIGRRNRHATPQGCEA